MALDDLFHYSSDKCPLLANSLSLYNTLNNTKAKRYKILILTNIKAFLNHDANQFRGRIYK